MKHAQQALFLPRNCTHATDKPPCPNSSPKYSHTLMLDAHTLLVSWGRAGEVGKDDEDGEDARAAVALQDEEEDACNWLLSVLFAVFAESCSTWDFLLCDVCW